MRVLLAILFFASAVNAQEYPNKAIKIVIPLTRGREPTSPRIAARMSGTGSSR
jgi:hypothetical protein